MAKVNSIGQVPKGVRLRWTSLKEVTSVKLSLDAIHGTRSSANGKFVTRDSNSGKFVVRKTVGNRNNNANDNFLIP